MQLLENGMTNRQIARALDLEVSTVKNHVHNVLAKCGVAGRGEVVAAAVTELGQPGHRLPEVGAGPREIDAVPGLLPAVRMTRHSYIAWIWATRGWKSL